MKGKWLRLSQRYRAALRQPVKRGPRMGFPLARRLGQQAAAMGASALDLARMHDQALANIGQSTTGDRAVKWTDEFFCQALRPLNQANRSADKEAASLKRLKKTLRTRTIQLARSQRIRKQGVIDRNAIKDVLRRKDKHYAELLGKSRDLQRSLQNLTRRMLSAQEDERARISRKLRDDVAQEMLGIQVRLAHFKNETARNTLNLKRDLGVTQRLVEKSAKTLERFAGRLSSENEG